jgi:DNA-binding Lrp family transcriptional regulator
MRAYVLIRKKRKREAPSILELIRRTKGVMSAREIAGASDIIALVAGASVDELGSLIDCGIAALPGVADARATFHLGE